MAKSKALVDIDAEMAKEVSTIQKSIGSLTGNRIKITQNKQFVAPDGQQEDGPLKLVIIDHTSQNMFYETAFDRDNPTPPTCFAIAVPASQGGDISTMAPSVDVLEKQSESCARCPMGEWGSAATGKGKACSNLRVLAVLPVDATEDTPISLLRVSPTGLRSFDGYVGSLATKFKQLPIGVVTEVSFNENFDYPSLVFKATGQNDQYAEHYTRREEARMLLTQEPDMSQKAEESSVNKKAPKRKSATSRRSA